MLAGLLVMLYAAFASYSIGFNHTYALIVCAGAALIVGLSNEKKGVLQVGVYRDAWAKETIKFVTTAMKSTFIEGIADYSKYVATVDQETQVINIASMNVLPEVLINNPTYPIGIADLAMGNTIVQVDKYQTVATPITDDEKFAMTADKMGLTKDRHAKAILIKMLKKSIFNLAPSGNTAKMPVLITSGADDGTGRKRLTMSDVLLFKGQCDNLEIDEENRRLVLCTDHVNDLIAEDKDFKALFYNRTTGRLVNMLSFQIDSYVANPYYNPTTKAKLAFGAIPSATDRKASVFFSLDRAAKAMGWTKAYIDEPDTQNQRTLYNVRQYGIVLPTAEELRGAIVSGNI